MTDEIGYTGKKLSTPKPMSLPSINFLHLMVSDIYSLGKILKVQAKTARLNQGHSVAMHTYTP